MGESGERTARHQNKKKNRNQRTTITALEFHHSPVPPERYLNQKSVWVLRREPVVAFVFERTMSNPGGASLSTDQLKARYVGTGHADMSKYEWVTNQHRDTYASHIGHYDQLSYFAVAQNESVGRTRLTFLERMVQPCGPPPPTKDLEKMLEAKDEE